MPRNVRLIGAVAAFVLAVGVPVLLVARALPPRTVLDLVATPSGEYPVLPVLYNQSFPVKPVPLKQTGTGSQRLEVNTATDFPDFAGTRVEVGVATYERTPTQAIHLTLLGSRGERLGFCQISPSDYHDNGIITCPVRRPSQLRRIVIAVKGTDPLALYAAKEGKQLVAGVLVRQRHLSSLRARLGALRAQLGILRPAFFSPVAIFVFLFLSIALLGAAWLVATGAEAQRE